MGVSVLLFFFFFQAEDGIRDLIVTGVQTCALPISMAREAQAVPNKTPYESYMVTRVIAQAAAGAGEPGVAAKAFEEITGSSSAADAERRQFAAAAAGQYYIAKDYAKAAELAARP